MIKPRQEKGGEGGGEVDGCLRVPTEPMCEHIDMVTSLRCWLTMLVLKSLTRLCPMSRLCLQYIQPMSRLCPCPTYDKYMSSKSNFYPTQIQFMSFKPNVCPQFVLHFNEN